MPTLPENFHNQVRQYKFRAWNGEQMDYDYRDAGLWNGILVAEGDTILMQSTGLTDCLGKEIYEGDIVRHETQPFEEIMTGDIYWEDGSFYFRQVLPKPHHGSKWVIYKPANQHLEVIGNIWENPELLEKN